MATGTSGSTAALPDTLTRTYIASFRSRPDLDPSRDVESPAGRRQLVFETVLAHEEQVRSTLAPKLDALLGAGLLDSYEFLPLAGAVVLHAPEGKAHEAWRGMRALPELGSIVRDEPMIFPGVRRQLSPSQTPPSSSVPPRGEAPAPNTRYPRAWQIERVRASELWDRGVTGAGVTIGVVDSGASLQHSALHAQYRGSQPDGSAVHDYNFFDPLMGFRELHDISGHGTAVTSLALGGIAAGGFSGVQPTRVGIAPEAKFISARVFGGTPSTLATKLRGMAWMLAPTDSFGANPNPQAAPDVVNMSFGDNGTDGQQFRPILEAYEAAGIVAVGAAGNGGRSGPGTIVAPAGFPTVLAAGFTGGDDTVDERSAKGPGFVPNPDGTFPNKPDVVAPGAGVLTGTHDGGAAYVDGSSMSSAVVTGVVALLKSAHPSLTPAQVREAIRAGARDLGETGVDPVSGWGLVDAVASLRHAASLVAATKQKAA